MPTAFEYYSTPAAYTRFLRRWTEAHHLPICGRFFEPCVGDGAIVRAWNTAGGLYVEPTWTTNDIDARWAADNHLDARQPQCWRDAGPIHWTISNTPFSPAIEILDQALRHSRHGVIMHLRISIHEVLKEGIRRSWMRTRPPTGILFLPRFAFQRSRTTGKWTTDSATTAWVLWVPNSHTFIDYADEQCLDELDAETPDYRRRMDAIMAERGEVVNG